MECLIRAELEAVASDTSAALNDRIAAIEKLGSEPANIALLKSLFGRTPGAAEAATNWDPAAAQRVIELRAAAAMHRLGDDSELYRIPYVVRSAGRTLLEQEDELQHAANAIAAMGSRETIRDLIAAMQPADPPGASNLIETLNRLQLPEPPVRHDLGDVAGARLEVTGLCSSVRDLAGLITATAKRSVRVSPGVDEMIRSDPGRMGRTSLQRAPVSLLLQQLLPSVGLEYYVEGVTAVICTIGECAGRWQNWWAQYGAHLIYSAETQKFVLGPGAP